MNEIYEFVEGKLVNQYGQSVMMDWERPIMMKVAEILCSNGSKILNIGFGMGIVDSLIQGFSPDKHVIVENNPVVMDKIKNDGWYEKENVEIIFDKWQNVIQTIGKFDSIYLDTWNDHRVKYVNDLLDYCLNPSGKFLMWYNKSEFDRIVSNLSDGYSVSYEYIKNDNMIPPAEEQYKNGGFYIDPNLEYITIPIITKK
jgi:hypothetical protein